MTRRGWITVGVDGSEGSRTAARWAAHAANRVDAGLRVVHVFNDYLPTVGFYSAVAPLGTIEGRRLAEQTVREAAHQVRPILDGARLEQVVLRGDRRAGLLQAARSCDLMVLGDERHPTHHRLITGTIVGAVAAHSPVPLVVVPASCAVEPTRGVIVAGIKACASSAAVVRQAFDLAATLEARLVLVHAWEYSPPYDALIAAHLDLPGWAERAAKDLNQVVDEVSGEFPGVDAEARFVHGQPARVLTDASAHADLLAITRRVHGFPFDHLGGTGRAALRETRCPAMVLPPALETMPVPATITG